MKLLNIALPLLLWPTLAVAEPRDFNAARPAEPMILAVPAVTTAAPSNLVGFAFVRGVINVGRVDVVILRWKDNSSNEYSFRVESCTGATCKNFVEFARTKPNVTTQVTGQYYSFGKVIRYRVRANGPHGLSAYSNIVNIKMP